MSNQVLIYFMAIAGGLFVLILISYVILQKKMNKSDLKRIKELKAGTKDKSFSSDIMYQKLYVTYSKVPFLKRYLKKLIKTI